MIKLTTPTGTTRYVAPTAIACITEAGASSQWHGIKSYLKLFDGTTIECSETAEQVNAAIAAEGK